MDTAQWIHGPEESTVQLDTILSYIQSAASSYDS